MKASTHKRLYNWHSTTGLVATVLLVALCLTALPAIFMKDINHWLMPSDTFSSIDHAKPGHSIDAWLNQVEQQLDLSASEFHISNTSNAATYTLWTKQEDVFKAFMLDNNGQLITHHGAAASRILAQVHHNFLLPDPYGEYLVGLLGLAMLALVFMGVLLHTKWKKEKTQLRKKRSRRLFLSDLHKVLGFWLLPFHIFVSYTGATLGLGSLLLVVAAISAFNGDQDAAVEAVLGKEPILSGQTCNMVSPQLLSQSANAHWQQKYGDNAITDIEIHGWKDCNGQMTIASAIPGYLLASNALTYSLTAGELINEIDWIPSGMGERWYASLGPLHFGTYAGYVSQWLFFVSAILLAIMMVSGMLLWLNKQGSPTEKSYFIKALTATCMGICTASVALLATALFQNINFEGTQYDPTFYKYVYGLSFLLAAIICLINLRLWKSVCYMIAMTLITCSIIHLYYFDNLSNFSTSAYVNLAFVMCAMLFASLPSLGLLKDFSNQKIDTEFNLDDNVFTPKNS